MTSARRSKDYIIKRLTLDNLNQEFVDYFWSSAEHLNTIYGNDFKNYRDFNLRYWVLKHIFFVCYKKDKPVGFLFATLSSSIFDMKVKILQQQMLYASPGTRASVLLLKEFIDFGRSNANHIITMIGSETNIKPESLERLGFNKLETLYRIEV